MNRVFTFLIASVLVCNAFGNGSELKLRSRSKAALGGAERKAAGAYATRTS